MDKITEFNKSFNKFKTNLGNVFIGAGFIVGLIMTTIGLTLLIYQLYIYFKVNKINHWPVLKNIGTVENSYMETMTNSTSYSGVLASTAYFTTYYRTRVSFQYTTNDRVYFSHKSSYFEPWTTNPIDAKDETDKYKPGVKVDVRVNPNNPAEAYIENKEYAEYIKTGIGIGLFVIGLYIIYHT